MQKCDKCGEPYDVEWIDLDNGSTYLCADCNNKMVFEKHGIEPPEITRHRFILTDCENEHHLFDSEYIIYPVFKLLRCFERGPTRYKCEVQGKLDADYKEMFAEMLRRLRKLMSIKYMEHGTWADYTIYGYISHNEETERYDIIVDGKPYTWEEIGKGLRNLDGCQIKIVTANPTADLDPAPDLYEQQFSKREESDITD